MLTDQELQSLRNLGNQCEEAASEICSLRAALTQKRAEYEDLKQTMHNMARNHALQLEAARKHEPESVPELRAQLQTLGLWIAEALLTMEQAAQMVDAERARIAASLRRSGATLPAPEVKGTPESGIITGLCIALTLVESGPNARLTAPDTALQEQR